MSSLQKYHETVRQFHANVEARNRKNHAWHANEVTPDFEKYNWPRFRIVIIVGDTYGSIDEANCFAGVACAQAIGWMMKEFGSRDDKIERRMFERIASIWKKAAKHAAWYWRLRDYFEVFIYNNPSENGWEAINRFHRNGTDQCDCNNVWTGSDGMRILRVIACHGRKRPDQDDNENKFYDVRFDSDWLPSDVWKLGSSNRPVRSSVIVDCCFSGGIVGGWMNTQLNAERDGVDEVYAVDIGEVPRTGGTVGAPVANDALTSAQRINRMEWHESVRHLCDNNGSLGRLTAEEPMTSIFGCISMRGDRARAQFYTDNCLNLDSITAHSVTKKVEMPQFAIAVFDVGRDGDSLFIMSQLGERNDRHRYAIAVDGGPGHNPVLEGRSWYSELKHWLGESIPLEFDIVCTHADEDHIGALFAILDAARRGIDDGSNSPASVAFLRGLRYVVANTPFEVGDTSIAPVYFNRAMHAVARMLHSSLACNSMKMADSYRLQSAICGDIDAVRPSIAERMWTAPDGIDIRFLGPTGPQLADLFTKTDDFSLDRASNFDKEHNAASIAFVVTRKLQHHDANALIVGDGFLKSRGVNRDGASADASPLDYMSLLYEQITADSACSNLCAIQLPHHGSSNNLDKHGASLLIQRAAPRCVFFMSGRKAGPSQPPHWSTIECLLDAAFEFNQNVVGQPKQIAMVTAYGGDSSRTSGAFKSFLSLTSSKNVSRVQLHGSQNAENANEMLDVWRWKHSPQIHVLRLKNACRAISIVLDHCVQGDTGAHIADPEIAFQPMDTNKDAIVRFQWLLDGRVALDH
jgi:hypothetical protein